MATTMVREYLSAMLRMEDRPMELNDTWYVEFA